jgi:hypothetical protein
MFENEPMQTANLVMGALLALSELLSLTPLRSNGIFQLVANFLKMISFSGKDDTAKG